MWNSVKEIGRLDIVKVLMLMAIATIINDVTIHSNLFDIGLSIIAGLITATFLVGYGTAVMTKNKLDDKTLSRFLPDVSLTAVLMLAISTYVVSWLAVLLIIPIIHLKNSNVKS